MYTTQESSMFHGMSGLLGLALVMVGIALAALTFAFFYLQKTLGLPPCPLCIVDRLALLLLTGTLLAGLLGAYCWPGWQRVIMRYTCIFNVLWLVLGLWASGRHVLLQRFPSDAGTCIPELKTDLLDLLTRAFSGSSDCGAVLWTFMGLSIAEQTMLLFVLLSLLNLGLFYLTRPV